MMLKGTAGLVDSENMSEGKIWNVPGKGSILNMNASTASKFFRNVSIDLIVTSVPYFQQRIYTDSKREIGIEANPADYITALVKVFDAYANVLKDTGVIYVNIGDKRKDGALMAIPEWFTMAMVADGWEYVQEIVWHKPDAIPEGKAATRRPSRDHERILMFAKSSERCFYDHYAVRSETACLRTVWKIASSGKSKHHAPYPEELAMTAIIASSPEFVCSICGVPYRRLVDSVRRATRPGNENKVDPSGKSNRDRLRHVTEYTSKGHEKACRCEDSKPSPSSVLDMFCGSGTTPACAVMAGRFGYGVDLSYDFSLASLERLKRSSPGVTQAKKSPLAKFVNSRQLLLGFREPDNDEKREATKEEGRGGEGKAEADSTGKVPGCSQGNTVPFLPVFANQGHHD
jgi:DNA modification methylase